MISAKRAFLPERHNTQAIGADTGTLLMLGARAVLQNAGQKTDQLSRWAVGLRERRCYHRAVIEAD